MTYDDRVTCLQCADIGHCNGPFRAHPELPRRCEFFRAKQGAADQRSGRERYPTLWAEHQAEQAKRTRVRRETNQRGVARAKAALATQE